MRRAPIGAEVGLYMDTPLQLEVGMGIVTTTGRSYVVARVRRQARGRHAGRWHLRCVVVEEIPDGAPTVRLRWYRR